MHGFLSERFQTYLSVMTASAGVLISPDPMRTLWLLFDSEGAKG